MGFTKNYLSEDLPCENDLIAEDDINQTVWSGGDPITMLLLANDSDPNLDPFELIEIGGTPVANGSGPLSFDSGNITINVVDVSTGEITYQLAAAATAVAPVSYTIEDSNPTDPKQASAEIKPQFGICNPVIARGLQSGFDVFVQDFSTAAYKRGRVDVDGNGTIDATSGIVAVPAFPIVPSVTLLNGSAFGVELYKDSAGIIICGSDMKQVPTPNIVETIPGDPLTDPYIVAFSNATPDAFATYYNAGQDAYAFGLQITGGTYAGAYATIGWQEGGTPDITGYPVGLQALITTSPDGLEFHPDLWNIEGATTILIDMNVNHKYNDSAFTVNSITADTVSYSP